MDPIFVPVSPGGGYPGADAERHATLLKETQRQGFSGKFFKRTLSDIKAISKRRSEPLKKTRKRPEKDRPLSTIHHIPYTINPETGSVFVILRLFTLNVNR
jgi:hypothetical protein